jgi:glycosyltransferase involved in cell wall biosynthesis
VTTRQLNKLLLITGDPLGSQMAGPGIRCVNLAHALGNNGFQIKVITTQSFEKISGLDIHHVSSRDNFSFSHFHDWADAVIFQALAFDDFPSLRKSTKLLVADAYAPVVLESLARFKGIRGYRSRLILSQAGRIQREQVLRSDVLICANEYQRLYYMGALIADQGLTVDQFNKDENLSNRIVTIPFGLSESPPVHRKQVLKGVVPGISITDKVVLWSGGIYEWFDVETLIQAFNLLKHSSPEIKLYFQGGKHPNPDVPEMPVVARAKQLATDFGLLNNTVFFNDSWVSFEDRENYLMEADLGVTSHFDSLETTFAFRTRMLDYIWAGLPVVTTQGDFFAKEVKRLELGVVTKFSDPEDLSKSIRDLLADDVLYTHARKELLSLRPSYYWDTIVIPLIRAIHNSVPNQSRLKLGQRITLPLGDSSKIFANVRSWAIQSLEMIQTQGIKKFVSKLWRKIVH